MIRTGTNAIPAHLFPLALSVSVHLGQLPTEVPCVLLPGVSSGLRIFLCLSHTRPGGPHSPSPLALVHHPGTFSEPCGSLEQD